MKLNLGENIRTCRRRMDLTQEQLAERLGVSFQSVSRWENGSTYPDMELLPVLAGLFGVTVDHLLGCTEEMKQQLCAELTEKLEKSAAQKDTDAVLEYLTEIRRNIREYHEYWFWGIYHTLWKYQLSDNTGIMEELRRLTEEVFRLGVPMYRHQITEWMAVMEDEEHLDTFLDDNAADEDNTRTALLLSRYRSRRDDEKHEPLRQFYLWHTIGNLIDAPRNWERLPLDDAERRKWYCEINLAYLNALNDLHPDGNHIVRGSDTVDLWCQERIHIGLSYALALAKLGDTEGVFRTLHDVVSLLETVMAIREDEFTLTCHSPALQGLEMSAVFHWMNQEDGLEHRQLCGEIRGWSIWIMPNDYPAHLQHTWYDNVRDDPRFDEILRRMKACIITRPVRE